jgi:hypothetical protein
MVYQDFPLPPERTAAQNGYIEKQKKALQKSN